VIAIDTNVLVRYLIEDDADESSRAARLMEGAADRGESLFVAQIVLCEVACLSSLSAHTADPEERSAGNKHQRIAESHCHVRKPD